jgi:UDP-N-acetylmuramoyl-tripeptide--D-alanyl-D-alanine ligase
VIERQQRDKIQSREDWCLIEVEDSLNALQEVASAYRKRFTFPVIAITGSNGKTTTKEMIAQLLGIRYRTAKSPGNLNNHIGLALSICAWTPGDEAAVLEMGTNHFGEIRRLCEIANPTHGCITNIGKGHLKFFGDLEGVFRAKIELIDAMDLDSTVFLNGDDPFLQRVKDRIKRTITFGFSDGCTFRPAEWGVNGSGCPWMKIDGQDIRVGVPGRNQLYNALAAIAVAKTFDISWDRIQKTLSRFKSVDKRMEIVRTGGLVIVNDSYNANPTSVEQAVLTFASMHSLKRRIVCLGDMLELGQIRRTEHEKVAETVVNNKSDMLVCYGPETRATVEKAKQLGFEQARHFDDKTELIGFLLSYLQNGDGLLVKGSRGMKMEEVVQAVLSGKWTQSI